MTVKLRDLKMTKEYFCKTTKLENRELSVQIAFNFQEKPQKLVTKTSFSESQKETSKGLFSFGKKTNSNDLKSILSKQKVKSEQEANLTSQLEMINRLKTQLNDNDMEKDLQNLSIKVPKRAKSIALIDGNQNTSFVYSQHSINQLREHEEFLEKVKDPKNNINWRSSNDGSTLLHKAVIYEKLDIIEILIKEGYDPNAINNTQATPLIVAASLGNRESTLFLIQSGSKISNRDCYGYSPLLIALKHHHFHIIDDLLLFGGDINQKKENGMTILHEALQEGDDALIDHLLTHNNLKLNIKDPNGKTPLLRGCEKAKLKTFIKFLKKEGVDTFVVEDFSKNFFHLLVKNERQDIIEYFLQDLDLLTKHKKLLSDQDNKGKTPLHLAVEQSNFSVLKALVFIYLYLKIDFMSIKDTDGQTPYGYAFKKLNKEIEEIKKQNPTLDTETAFSMVNKNTIQIENFLKTYQK